MKPEPEPMEQDTKPSATSKSKRKNPKANGSSKHKASSSGKKRSTRKWTSAEFEALFAVAMPSALGPKNFEGKVGDRSGNQCYLAWRNRLQPLIIDAIRKAGADAASAASPGAERKGDDVEPVEPKEE